jgi:hypothetical protein
MEILHVEIHQHRPENEFRLQFGTMSVVKLKFRCRENAGRKIRPTKSSLPMAPGGRTNSLST